MIKFIQLIKKDNPDWAIAYKENPEANQTVVVGVEWNSATNNALKPKIIYQPITTGQGTTLRKATVYNADYVQKK